MHLNYNHTNLSTTRGDTIHFGVEIFGLDEDLQSASFAVKKYIDDEQPIFKINLGSGIYKIDNNHYGVMVPPSITKKLDVDKYYYDLEITVRDEVYTILKGLLKVEYDIS